ncbi:MAG: hypothetical protein NXI32_14830 [bacterium]|nr:hypothetical protein [bacterium]
MKRKLASGELENRSGASGSSSDGLIPAPHILHPRGLSEDAPSLAGNERLEDSEKPMEQRSSNEQTRPIFELDGEYPYQPATSIPFLTSCLVACAFCSIFWLMLFLTIWYLYQ